MIRRNAVGVKFTQKQEFYNNLRISPITIPPGRDCKPRMRIYEIPIKKFEYPFSYITSCEYPVNDILECSENDISVYEIDLFPYSISEMIWASVTDTSWDLLCRLHNGIYVLYEAGCSPMGFTIKHSSSPTPERMPGASMRMIAGNTLEYIIHRMSLSQYNLYMKKTIPFTLPRPSCEDSGDEIC